MQNKHEGILRAINNKKEGFNILTFVTHERYSSNLASMPHTFYLWQGEGIKPWSHEYAPLPKNHILLDGTQGQVKQDMKFDIVWSQNKFGQFNVAQQLASALNLPLVSLEHTLPVPQWNERQRKGLLNMRGDVNVFISEYSIKEWGFDPNDPSVRTVHHAVDSNVFRPSEHRAVDGRILSVVNDYVNRDWCCGYSIYERVTKGLPTNPVGSTPGLSEPASSVADLVFKYQTASVFLNTSIISPVPTALLEAMSCGCPVVSTATCMIPEIIENGVNGFVSNDDNYLREKLVWCLNNPEEAKTIGKRGRETILSKFSISKHLDTWNNIFKEVYGRPYNA